MPRSGITIMLTPLCHHLRGEYINLLPRGLHLTPTAKMCKRYALIFRYAIFHVIFLQEHD